MDESRSIQLRRDLANLTSRRSHMAERFLAEMEFAEALARLQPRKAAAWEKLMDRAWRTVAEAVASGRLNRLNKAVRTAEETLAPLGEAAKTYTVHCVGHAHIDMNWMWSWPETVAVTNDTFVTVLKLMEEFPEFCFSQSQASVYAIVCDYAPELLEPIRRRVAEGRWEVTAVHWVEGDKNLACGESLARHMLYARRSMKELFALEPEDVPLDWECDTFGHAHTIPTIITGGAARRYYMCRAGMPERPPVFWWQGPDGARVLVYFDRTGYNGQIDPQVIGHMIDFCAKTGINDYMWVYGVGDHGGGPTRRDILRAREMNSWPIWPNFRLGTAGKFYEILEARGRKWPVLDEEINFEFTGCYTSQSAIKQANRLGENYCLEAESAAALALSAVGRDYPAEALRQAWVDVLFGQFHDILPGSGVHWTRQYQVGLFQKVAAATSMIKTHSYRALAAAVDTSFAQAELPAPPPGRESTAMGAGAGRGAMVGGLSQAAHVSDGPRPLVIFNPTAWQRREVVQATVWDVDDGRSPGRTGGKSFVVRGRDGKVIGAQRIGAGDYWGHKFVELAFPAAVDALGHAAYAVETGSAGDVTGAVSTYEVPIRHEPHAPTAPAMANELLAVEFDSLTGGVVKLLDKTTGKDLADKASPLGVLEYILERPRGMSAWTISQTQTRLYPLAVQSLQWVQRGPRVASLAARARVRSSDVTVTYTLKAGQPWLEITVETMWLERGDRSIGTPSLRMRFPLALSQAKGRYEIPFGSIERDLIAGQEVPALRWADVVGNNGPQTAGCALLNDSKYGHSLEGSTLRLTLIRSSYEPDPLPEIREHTIRMAVLPHGKPLPTGDLVRLGASFNHPLQVVSTDAHKGRLPAAGAAVSSIRPANIVLSSVKKAEADDAVVFRLYETDGRAANARVVVDETLWGRPAEAVQVDLLERPVKNSTAKAGKNAFSVAVPAHGIASVKVHFER